MSRSAGVRIAQSAKRAAIGLAAAAFIAFLGDTWFALHFLQLADRSIDTEQDVRSGIGLLFAAPAAGAIVLAVAGACAGCALKNCAVISGFIGAALAVLLLPLVVGAGFKLLINL